MLFAPGRGSSPPPAIPDGTPVAALRATLLDTQDATGGWGAHAGRPPATEPTALAALALAQAGEGTGAPGVRAALAWLAGRQRQDGSWPATDQVPAPSWMTADALLALSVLGVEPERRARAVTWLVRQRSARVPWILRVSEWWRGVRGEKINDLDLSLTAWPWAEGTFGWVEPTALALLALRAAAARDSAQARDPQLAERVRLGELMLVDRMTPGGGWNSGNGRVLGADQAPYPDTTAWALLALRASDGRPAAGTGKAVVAGLDRLQRMLGSTRSPLAHALGALAFRAHGRDDRGSRAILAAYALDARAARPDTRTRALALLALEGSTFPLGA